MRVLRYKFFDNFTVFGVVSQANLCEVRLPNQAVTSQMTVAVGLQEAGIDEVFTVIQHLRIRASELFRLFRTADIGKHTVLHQCSLGKGSLFIHGNDVAQNNRLFHSIILLLCIRVLLLVSNKSVSSNFLLMLLSFSHYSMFQTMGGSRMSRLLLPLCMVKI